MKIQNVKEYNHDEMIKYSRRCAEWEPEKGGFPQQVFYGFYTRLGNFRETGFVASDDKRAFWAKTKREAIKKYNKE